MEKYLWSDISPVYRPIEVLFTLLFPGFEGLNTDIQFVGTSC